jgi:hypothetical protein
MFLFPQATAEGQSKGAEEAKAAAEAKVAAVEANVHQFSPLPCISLAALRLPEVHTTKLLSYQCT